VMPFSSNIEDEAEIVAASGNRYNSSKTLWTVPELFFGKKQLIPAFQQPLISNLQMEDK
jgi:hypothetical protein